MIAPGWIAQAQQEVPQHHFSPSSLQKQPFQHKVHLSSSPFTSSAARWETRPAAANVLRVRSGGEHSS